MPSSSGRGIISASFLKPKTLNHSLSGPRPPRLISTSPLLATPTRQPICQRILASPLPPHKTIYSPIYFQLRREARRTAGMATTSSGPGTPGAAAARKNTPGVGTEVGELVLRNRLSESRSPYVCYLSVGIEVMN
jgi:hypothetical protein